eukprot:GABV01001372.1.p1 GENE.GABV01001372.1~~GABV01001372.1.p1  ORF type:complete len:219 (-),score=33.28 GABV01001372.1:89-745(-)
MDDAFVHRMLSVDAQQEYQTALLKTALVRMDDVRFCPGVDCPNAVIVDVSNEECRVLLCEMCNTEWCRDCRHPNAHVGRSCAQAGSSDAKKPPPPGQIGPPTSVADCPWCATPIFKQAVVRQCFVRCATARFAGCAGKSLKVKTTHAPTIGKDSAVTVDSATIAAPLSTATHHNHQVTFFRLFRNLPIPVALVLLFTSLVLCRHHPPAPFWTDCAFQD